MLLRLLKYLSHLLDICSIISNTIFSKSAVKVCNWGSKIDVAKWLLTVCVCRKPKGLGDGAEGAPASTQAEEKGGR